MKDDTNKNGKSTENANRSSKPTDFRFIKTYNATSMVPEERQAFKKIIRDKKIEYNQVGILSYAQSFFKYLSLDTALLCIENGTIQFVEPSRWQDKYERRFYEADYSVHNTNPQDTPLLFSTCVTTTRFNEAAWKLYTYGKTGLGVSCVEFQINKFKFRQQLVKAVGEMDKIYEGVVMYCSQSMIDNIHLKEVDGKEGKVANKYHSKYVERREGVPYINNYLNLLLMKRDAFKHENETRFFILKSDKIGTKKAQQRIEGDKVYWGETIILNIDWIDIIDKVYINVKEDSREYQLLSNALWQQLMKKYMGDNNAPLWQCIGGGNGDAEKFKKVEQIWKERLKPESYFVYGKVLDKPLVME